MMKYEIETMRMILRPFQPKDADDILPCTTPTLTRYMRWEKPKDAVEFEKIWHKWPVQYADELNCIFIARSKAEQAFIGLFGIHDYKTATPRFGLWVREDLHQQGFGPEGINAIMDWARENYQPSHFIYQAAVDNMPSRKLVERLGGVAVAEVQEVKFKLIVYHIPA